MSFNFTVATTLDSSKSKERTGTVRMQTILMHKKFVLIHHLCQKACKRLSGTILNANVKMINCQTQKSLPQTPALKKYSRLSGDTTLSIRNHSARTVLNLNRRCPILAIQLG